MNGQVIYYATGKVNKTINKQKQIGVTKVKLAAFSKTSNNVEENKQEPPTRLKHDTRLTHV